MVDFVELFGFVGFVLLALIFFWVWSVGWHLGCVGWWLVGFGCWVRLVGFVWLTLFVGFGLLVFYLVGLVCRAWVVCGWLVAG